MGDNSHIEWTDATWNPVVGCTHVSDGCGTFVDGKLVAGGCYAARQASGRLSKQPAYAGLADAGRFTGEVRLLPERLKQPFTWTRPRIIFVNSMSDLFHDSVPDDFIAEVWAVMSLNPQHIFQVLTKRHARAAALLRSGNFWVAVNAHRLRRARPVLRGGGPVRLPNVWLGVSAEDQKWAAIRIPYLLSTPAAVRFVSLEPLLGGVDLTDLRFPGATGAARWNALTGVRTTSTGADVADGRLDWVIAGGESGPKARPMHPAWARKIRDDCDAAGVPFHFKQWGEWGEAPDLFTQTGDVCLSENGERYDVPPAGYVCAHNESDGVWLRRVGKRAAGRMLDGRTHDDMPARHAPASP